MNLASTQLPPTPTRPSTARIPLAGLLNPAPQSQQGPQFCARSPASRPENEDRASREVLPPFSSISYPPSESYAPGETGSDSPAQRDRYRNRSHSYSAISSTPGYGSGSAHSPLLQSQHEHRALEGRRGDLGMFNQRDDNRQRASGGMLATLFSTQIALIYILHSSRSMMTYRKVIGRK